MAHTHVESRQGAPFNSRLYIPLGVAAVMAAVLIYQVVLIMQARRGETPQRDVQYWFLLLWSAFNLVAAGFTGLWYQFPGKPVEGPTDQRVRDKLVLLFVGGSLGFTTMLLGLCFVWEWWDILTGGRTNWKENWRTWAPVGMIVVGLAAMFASLLTIRSEERSNATLRRLLYGYNAVLTGLLVVAILGVFNVVSYFYGTQHVDFTEGHIYSISEQTRHILQELPKPVTVFVVMPGGDPLRSDLGTLLNSFKTVAGAKVEVVEVSPTLSREAVNLQQIGLLQQLGQSYPELRDANGVLDGVLVTYEGQQGEKLYEVLKRTPDLQDVGFGRETSRTFKGEQAIMSAIVRLREGKKNAILYFTQGNGELDLKDSSLRSGLDRGVGALKEELSRANYAYEAKELRLESQPGSETPPKIPDDAFAVVMAGPDPITDLKKLEPLREYMKKPNAKMLVFLDVKRNREGVIQPTGLENFLAEFGVRVGRDIILSGRPPLCRVEVAGQADRQIQDSLGGMNPFFIIEARSVRAENSPQFTAKPFLETMRLPQGPHGQWADDVKGAGQALADYIRKLHDERRAEFEAKINGQPVPVAVTVRTKSEQAPDPHDPHAFMREDKGEPRMVVFGDATMISNGGLASELGDPFYLTFQNALSWLRGRPEMLSAIKPVKRSDYRLQIGPDQSSRLRWLSGPALLLVIIAGGTAVWFMRRR